MRKLRPSKEVYYEQEAVYAKAKPHKILHLVDCNSELVQGPTERLVVVMDVHTQGRTPVQLNADILKGLRYIKGFETATVQKAE